MTAVEKFITGLTIVAVGSTVFGSKYSRGIIDAIFGGVARSYAAAGKAGRG